MRTDELLRELTHHLTKSDTLQDEVLDIKKEIAILRAEMCNLKHTQATTDEGWMSLKLASMRIGLSASALAQRFRRGHYPEGVVWRKEGNQDNPKCRYLVHLANLRRHMNIRTN